MFILCDFTHGLCYENGHYYWKKIRNAFNSQVCITHIYIAHKDRYAYIYFLMAPGLSTSAGWNSHFGFAK